MTASARPGHGRSHFQRPTLVLSRCLEIDSCRYNGLAISAPIVKRLQPFADLIPVCPELEIGLGVPRDPISLVRTAPSGEPRLVQLSTGRDLTRTMHEFCSRFLGALSPATDGFLLKSRSPSCGIHDAKVRSGAERGSAILGRAPGLFGAAVLAAFPELPVTHEGRMLNFRLREHWLTSVFTLARFRETVEACASSGRIGALVELHARLKLLLLAQGRVHLERLGKIAANPERRKAAGVLDDYGTALRAALARPSRSAANVDVLLHAMGHMKKMLSPGEKAFFLDSLEEYRQGRLPLSACCSMLRSWAVRFGNDYLLSQAYFEPYPRELLELTDSGLGLSRGRP
ncbi:DUF523 and DUF1722 domain-containing protein [Candidatus Fermentibacterales bacterium]|nr:DUF523 and DUF1722 domain-containing protein [Candidatus Fermentibacterales bacterium]